MRRRSVYIVCDQWWDDSTNLLEAFPSKKKAQAFIDKGIKQARRKKRKKPGWWIERVTFHAR